MRREILTFPTWFSIINLIIFVILGILASSQSEKSFCILMCAFNLHEVWLNNNKGRK